MSAESAKPFFWLVGPVNHTGTLWSNFCPGDIVQELHIFGFLIGIYYLFIDLHASIEIFLNTTFDQRQSQRTQILLRRLGENKMWKMRQFCVVVFLFLDYIFNRLLMWLNVWPTSDLCGIPVRTSSTFSALQNFTNIDISIVWKNLLNH